MEEEESRPFGLKWRLIRWNRLRIWVGLGDPRVAEPCHATGFEQRNIGPQNRLRRSFQRPDEGAHLKSVAVLEALLKATAGHLNRGQRSRRRSRAGGLRDGGPRGPVRR